MKVENITFLDSLNYLPFPLRKLRDAFGLTSSKSLYPHWFNTSANLDYVGPIPDVSYYCVEAMSHSEREDFLAWYESQKGKISNDRQVLESYCKYDFAVLRQVCQIFRRKFLELGKIEVFLEAISTASACKKVFRKQFRKPDRIGLIPTVGYTNNSPQSKEALMWLAYKEQTDTCTIRHGRNGREYRLPELHHTNVDGYCEETRMVYEFNGCYWHGCPVVNHYVTCLRWAKGH
jgi:hypothetical protein